MVAAWTLVPAPRDPVVHLETAHARARQHLVRLTAHDPGREVTSAMTNELFDRLTDARPAPLTAPAGAGRYTYTPRKVLRRVLDHALDHLNQIDQWLRGAATARPDADRRLGAVDGDAARRPAAAGAAPTWTRGSGASTRPRGSSFSARADSPPKSSTGRRPTAAGPFAGSFTTWRAPRCSIRRRWTRRCGRRIRRRGTRRPAAGSPRPSARRASPGGRSVVYPASMASSAPDQVIEDLLAIEGELRPARHASRRDSRPSASHCRRRRRPPATMSAPCASTTCSSSAATSAG